MKVLLTKCSHCGGKVRSETQVCSHCGENPAATRWEAEARLQIARGNTISAIMVVRAGTGLELKQAKDLVDGWLNSEWWEAAEK